MAYEKIYSSGVVNPFNDYNIGDTVRLTMPKFVLSTIVNDERTTPLQGNMKHGNTFYFENFNVGQNNTYQQFNFEVINDWNVDDSIQWSDISGYIGYGNMSTDWAIGPPGGAYVNPVNGDDHGIFSHETAGSTPESGWWEVIEYQDLSVYPEHYNSDYAIIASGLSFMIADSSGGYLLAEPTNPSIIPSGNRYDYWVIGVGQCVYAFDKLDSFNYTVTKKALIVSNGTAFSTVNNHVETYSMGNKNVSSVATGEFTQEQVITTITDTGGSSGSWWIETSGDLRNEGDGYYDLTVERLA